LREVFDLENKLNWK